MRRHELDPISLIFGFAFTGLGVLFLIGQADQALRLRWVWPILLLALGAAILLDVTRGRPTTDPAAAPDDADPDLALPTDPAPDPESDPAPDATTVDIDPAPAPRPAVDQREHPI